MNETIEYFLDRIKTDLKKIHNPFFRETLLLTYAVGSFTGVMLIALIMAPVLLPLWAAHVVAKSRRK